LIVFIIQSSQMQWPNHIKNSIFWYLWKLRIKDINQQYLDKFRYYDSKYDYVYGLSDYIRTQITYKIHQGYGRLINYRSVDMFFKVQMLLKLHVFNLITEQAIDIIIPKYYWFSSGINNPNGYK